MADQRPALPADRIGVLAARRISDGDVFELGGLHLQRDDVQWLLAAAAARGDGATPLRLREVDATGADLSGLRLDGVDLSGARLAEANMQRASLRGANLTEAVLTGAECEHADFRDARLASAVLDRCGLMWARLDGATLTHTSLIGASMPDACFDRADLLQADLTGAYLGAASLVEANLLGARMRDAQMIWCRLERATLSAADLTGATLWRARLDGANVSEALLDRANLSEAHLEGANFAGASLLLANLSRAFLDGATDLTGIRAGSGGENGLIVADAHWNDANLTTFAWSEVRQLGDETVARRADGKQGRPTRAEAYVLAARASRQVAKELSGRGMTEEANRFAYRAQVAQRRAFLHAGPRRAPQYLFSVFLSTLSGYGYRPSRGLIAYLTCIGTFAALYHAFGAGLTGLEAFVVSVTAFHGRGFFPDTFAPGDPLSIIAAGEAFVGLIIEVVLIATITQRLFGK
ncbi:pentapeptide repeat-containing protein [Catellatospora bangladeshensis]|uniref:Pentapeptide repeat-containing protein n=1 Tax=Catellatospora bangladeshensis TaxID=310355 RepID=A0A8J3JCV3_9ACTN|nr:pentapeptide repeat-containing protein [Catellatospora bangladeshensis]GIF82011.1 hypothetical protein Cba03nite_33600 [Catellatospora bangladeshensis]